MVKAGLWERGEGLNMAGGGTGRPGAGLRVAGARCWLDGA